MDAFHFLETYRKFILDIAGCIRVMGKFYMVMKAIAFGRYTKALMPLHAFFFPMLIPLLLRTRPDKKLHLHLLKLPHPENELPCYDFIPESFTNLRNTKGYFHASGFLNIE